MNFDPAQVVLETTEQREAGKDRPMTIGEAFEEARWLRRIPDGVLTPEIAKKTIEVLFAAIDAHPSLCKALERGQEVFVLVQQDRAAPAAIITWAGMARQHGCPEAKCADANRKAVRWLEQPEDCKKWPD